MKEKLRKFLRTAQTHFPLLENTKFILLRFVRKSLNIPFEKDFEALKFFPDIENALYLDVGSNRGEAIDAIQTRIKNAKILAFEPNEFLSKKLEQRFRDSSNVSIKNFGLGNKTGAQTLYLPSYRGWMFSGLASFHKEHIRSWLRKGLYFYNDKHLKLRQLKCKLIKLDDLKLKPFFIKLDIQGYEYQALKGGGKP